MSNTNGPQLRRTLGLFDGVALLVGITIGSGIYSTPHLIAGYFPSYSAVITTWIIVGLFVMIGGLIYAELRTRLPTTRRQDVFPQRYLRPLARFLVGLA